MIGNPLRLSTDKISNNRYRVIDGKKRKKRKHRHIKNMRKKMLQDKQVIELQLHNIHDFVYDVQIF